MPHGCVLYRTLLYAYGVRLLRCSFRRQGHSFLGASEGEASDNAEFHAFFIDFYLILTLKFIDMITLTHTSDLELPLSARSYLDDCCHEYQSTDAWTKIAQIAYRIKRGANFLQEFVEDINRHKVDPAYSNYEYLAKRSLGYYIELLRTNEEQDITRFYLFDKMSFPALYQLMVEEILYRYWEEDLYNDNKVGCHFDKVHYDYDEIAKRYTGENATKEFFKYISTSKETLRNIDITSYSIKMKNCWEHVSNKIGYINKVWSEQKEDELIYPGDETFIHQFNENTESKYKFIVGVPPMPFSGNLLKSKVVILTLNPGYIESVNKDKCIQMDPTEKKQLLQLIREALLLHGRAIYNEYECSRVQGDYYWQKSFAKIAMDAYGKPSSEINHPIYEDIAFLQLIGYHSEKFKYSTKIKSLPSSIFNNLLVKYLATKTDKTFLVLRSENLWKEVFGDDLWNKLEAEGRIITKGHKGMSQAITRGNIKKDNGYDKLVKVLSGK